MTFFLQLGQLTQLYILKIVELTPCPSLFIDRNFKYERIGTY